MSIGASELTIGEGYAPSLIAFYLTQFHPTPENDLWWGKGFTEWTNVTKASPLFEWHRQPHLPSDFGFYDLRVRETRHDQIRAAKQYGIDGFCCHYRWFSGTHILNRPLDDMLADPESDMPSCLCWANEDCTRRWDAADHEILIAQKHLPEGDLNFTKSLAPFFQDRRYNRVEGKPFLIEPGKPNQNPYIESFNGCLRDECLNEHWFVSLAHARAVIESWRREYNEERPTTEEISGWPNAVRLRQTTGR